MLQASSSCCEPRIRCLAWSGRMRLTTLLVVLLLCGCATGGVRTEERLGVALADPGASISSDAGEAEPTVTPAATTHPDTTSSTGATAVQQEQVLAPPPSDSSPSMAAYVVSESATALPPKFDSEQFRHYFYDLLIAEMVLQQGDYETAITSYLALSRLLRDDALARYTAHIALNYGRMEYALDAALTWLEISPEQYDARRAVAVLMLLNADVEESARQFVALIENFDTAAHSVRDEVIQLLMRDETNPVMLDVATLLAHHFEISEPLWRLATNLSLNGDDNGRTERFLLRAVELGADPIWAEKVRCRQLLAKGKKGEAAIRYQILVAGNSDNQALRESHADFLRNADFLRAARDEYSVLLTFEPKSSIYRFWIAVISVALEEPNRAFDMFAELYRDDFRVFRDGYRVHDVAFYAAQILDQQAQSEAALLWYSRVSADEYTMSAGIRRAELLSLLGRHEESQRHLGQLRDENPALAMDLYLFEINILRQKGLFAQALELTNQALDLHPEDSGLLYARAMLYNEVDDIDALERDLRELIRRDENDGVALNALGYTLADKTDRYTEAYELIQRAIQLLPDDPAVIDSVGWVYYKLGRLDKAEIWLRRALELSDGAEITFHLAQVLHDMGRLAESCELAASGLQKDPQHVRLFILRRSCQQEEE